MSFLELAHSRYSCRDFSDRPVTDEQVSRIIEAGIVAPTAVNYQPFRIWVIRSEEALNKVRQTGKFRFLQQSSCVFVIGAKPEEGWVRSFDGRNFADVDASIAATHMLLEIEDLGLGTTWVGHFDAPLIRQLFPEMEGYDLIAMFPVGYPSENAKPSPKHTEYRPEDELVTRL